MFTLKARKDMAHEEIVFWTIIHTCSGPGGADRQFPNGLGVARPEAVGVNPNPD